MKARDGTPIALTPGAIRGLDRLAAALKKQRLATCVLVVDDDENDSHFIARALQAVDEKIVVRLVRTGQQAIDYLEGQEEFSDRSLFPMPSVVLLDLGLPCTSGMDVLKHIRTKQHLEDAVVVTLTGSDDHRDAEEAQRLGVSAYIRKPESGLNFVGIIHGLRTSGLI